ncbi:MULTISPECIES: transposase [unclassified Stenotrophomonas]|uniref:transposase n=1 Tax=unclassified Stenotrophomonas TaxID=196198 RepID=UPI0021BBC4CA|nr:transposase [Stenotrophomonas sp. DR822]
MYEQWMKSTMPVHIQYESPEVIELSDLVEHLRQSSLDPRDHDSMISVAPALKQLANNRDFLSEMICGELKDNQDIQADNDYTPQVFMLHAPQVAGQSYFLRACFWPGENDEILLSSGKGAFFYGVPHDHNFNFLTVGYQGPGYSSDYFEYDYAKVPGVPGEQVDLKFIERSALSEGKILLYRAFTDIHRQIAPERFSVSINIMEHSLRSVTMDQYEFHPENWTISNVINRSSALPMFMIAAGSGNGEAQHVLRDIFRSHAVERVRMAALEALVASSPTPDAALELVRLVHSRHSRFMRGRALQLAARIEQGAGHADN